ncbi:MAG: hypothetical protein IJE73_06700 [Muribaculaceae bacterium]|nr:hypothetical protein [Muribaculaceae bacterium]
MENNLIETWKNLNFIDGSFSIFNIIFDARDLTVKIQPIFTDEDEIITLDFFDIIAYRVTDEQFYMTGLDDTEVETGVFYKVEKSKYVEWYMNKGIQTIRRGEPEPLHYVIYTEEVVIDIITDNDFIIRQGNKLLYGLKNQ